MPNTLLLIRAESGEEDVLCVNLHSA